MQSGVNDAHQTDRAVARHPKLLSEAAAALRFFCRLLLTNEHLEQGNRFTAIVVSGHHLQVKLALEVLGWCHFKYARDRVKLHPAGQCRVVGQLGLELDDSILAGVDEGIKRQTHLGSHIGGLNDLIGDALIERQSGGGRITDWDLITRTAGDRVGKGRDGSRGMQRREQGREHLRWSRSRHRR